MRKLYILILLLQCSIYSCDSSNDENNLQSIINQFSSLNKDSAGVYIFYGLSCRTCTEAIIAYVKKSLSKPDNSSQFIFTDINSIKELDHVFGNISENPRIIIDLNHSFYPVKYSEDFKFPLKIQFEEGNILRIESLEIDYFRNQNIIYK